MRCDAEVVVGRIGDREPDARVRLLALVVDHQDAAVGHRREAGGLAGDARRRGSRPRCAAVSLTARTESGGRRRSRDPSPSTFRRAGRRQARTTHASAPPASGIVEPEHRGVAPRRPRVVARYEDDLVAVHDDVGIERVVRRVARDPASLVEDSSAAREPRRRPGIGIGITVGRVHVRPASSDRAKTRSFCFSAESALVPPALAGFADGCRACRRGTESPDGGTAQCHGHRLPAGEIRPDRAVRRPGRTEVGGARPAPPCSRRSRHRIA